MPSSGFDTCQFNMLYFNNLKIHTPTKSEKQRLVVQWYFLVILLWEVKVRVPSWAFVVQGYKQPLNPLLTNLLTPAVLYHLAKQNKTKKLRCQNN